MAKKGEVVGIFFVSAITSCGIATDDTDQYIVQAIIIPAKEIKV